MRKGVCLATLDFVQSLCETSSGLIEIFPMEYRMQALREVCHLQDSVSRLISVEGNHVLYLDMGLRQQWLDCEQFSSQVGSLNLCWGSSKAL